MNFSHFVLFAALLPSMLFGSIIEINTLDAFAEALDASDADTLVVFDIDDVLFRRTDAILQRANYGFLDAQFDTLCAHITKAKKEELGSHFDCKAAFEPVDTKMAGYIKKLQERSIPVIGLTARTNGPYGLIGLVEAHTADRLAACNIRFTAFGSHDGHIFREFSGKRVHPLFKHGILFVDQFPKGDVFMAFLKEVQYAPKKVIFIDDRRHNLESLERALPAYVEACLFHYTAAEKQSKVVDKELALLQLTHLIEHEEWLSDSKAEQHRSQNKLTITQNSNS